MVRLADIQDKFSTLIGWSQDNFSQDKISEYLTVSDSGKYFQDEHPLISLDNLRSIAPDFSDLSYEQYDSQKNYKKNYVVKYNSNCYKAKVDSIGKQPDVNTEYWIKTDGFSEWLYSKMLSSIQRAILRFCTNKQSNFITSPICENKVLFTGTGRLCDKVENKSNYVGFELDFARHRGVIAKLNRIGLQFTQAGDYTIYIMHSSSYEPIYTLTLTKNKANTFEWFNLDNIIMPFVSEKNDAGGSWYIVYSQNELPEGSMAIEKQRDWSKKPCEACMSADYNLWIAWSQYLEVHPFLVNSEFVDNVSSQISMWDAEKNIYTNLTNYGLNLDITIECDITDFLIEQRNIFTDVISKQFAVDMLKEFAYNSNVRTNRHSINASRQDIIMLLDGGQSPFEKSGLISELENSFKALDFSTRGISKVCLACKNNGIKYRSI